MQALLPIDMTQSPEDSVNLQYSSNHMMMDNLFVLDKSRATLAYEDGVKRLRSYYGN